ncbi:hypothetical protein KC339_g23 [Hortaea werneckii]|nr:hypothetical protein KC339_g23 [Hortaea werneckii]
MASRRGPRPSSLVRSTQAMALVGVVEGRLEAPLRQNMGHDEVEGGSDCFSSSVLINTKYFGMPSTPFLGPRLGLWRPFRTLACIQPLSPENRTAQFSSCATTTTTSSLATTGSGATSANTANGSTGQARHAA